MYRNAIADLQLCVDDIDEAYIASAKALLISGTALAEKAPPGEAALKAVMLAKKTDTPSSSTSTTAPYNWKNPDEIAIYYYQVAREARIILGSREEYDLTCALIAPGLDDDATAAHFFGQNAQIVVIKHGKQGSTAHTADGGEYTIKSFPIQGAQELRRRGWIRLGLPLRRVRGMGDVRLPGAGQRLDLPSGGQPRLQPRHAHGGEGSGLYQRMQGDLRRDGRPGVRRITHGNKTHDHGPGAGGLLDNQYVSVDGHEIKFVDGVITIFGHGIVCGLGQALDEKPGQLKVLSGQERAGHGPSGHGLRQAARPAQDPRRGLLHRTGRGQHGYRRGHGLGQQHPPPAGDARGRLLHPPARSVLQQVEQASSLSTTNDAFRAGCQYWDRVSRPSSS